MKFAQADKETFIHLFGEEKYNILSGALNSEEGELPLGLRIEGSVKTQEEIQKIKTDSELQGKELRSKELAKALGLTLDAGEKDPVKIAEKLKTSITTSLEEKYKNPKPGEREKELEENLKAEQLKYNKLLETHESTKGEIEDWQTKYEKKEKEIKTKERNNSILKSFPEKMKMDRNDALLIFANTFEFDESEGQQVIKRNGEIVTDSIGKPEKLENIVSSFAEEKQWLKGAGMNGGDRGGSGGKKGGRTPDEATKIVKEKYGDNATSPEGIKLYNELTATAE
jgi:hypothetical protein